MNPQAQFAPPTAITVGAALVAYVLLAVVLAWVYGTELNNAIPIFVASLVGWVPAIAAVRLGSGRPENRTARILGRSGLAAGVDYLLLVALAPAAMFIAFGLLWHYD